MFYSAVSAGRTSPDSLSSGEGRLLLIAGWSVAQAVTGRRMLYPAVSSGYYWSPDDLSKCKDRITRNEPVTGYGSNWASAGCYWSPDVLFSSERGPHFAGFSIQRRRQAVTDRRMISSAGCYWSPDTLSSSEAGDLIAGSSIWQWTRAVTDSRALYSAVS